MNVAYRGGAVKCPLSAVPYPQYDQRMLADSTVFRGKIVLPDRVVEGEVHVRNGRISEVVERTGHSAAPAGAAMVDAGDGYIAPGYVDLHVHGGAGADFMDDSCEAVGCSLAAHLRHGSTSLLATTTAATHESIMAMLAACRHHRGHPQPGKARLLGVHLYGPYFRREARGCHPGGPIRPPDAAEYQQYLADGLVVTASVAPELPGAEPFVRNCVKRGVRAGAGHSHATFDQMAAAVGWGVRHVDHLFCAMSDKAKLRQEQAYPMRGGVLEATLYFDELTTEVIADGKHLSADLTARRAAAPGLDSDLSREHRAGQVGLPADDELRANRLRHDCGQCAVRHEMGDKPADGRARSRRVGRTLRVVGLASGKPGVDGRPGGGDRHAHGQRIRSLGWVLVADRDCTEMDAIARDLPPLGVGYGCDAPPGKFSLDRRKRPAARVRTVPSYPPRWRVGGAALSFPMNPVPSPLRCFNWAVP